MTQQPQQTEQQKQTTATKLFPEVPPQFYYPEYIKAQYVMSFARYNLSFGIEQMQFLITMILQLRPLRPDVLTSPDYLQYLASVGIQDDAMLVHILSQLEGQIARLLAYKATINERRYFKEDPKSKHYQAYIKESGRIASLRTFLLLHTLLFLLMRNTNLEQLIINSYHYESAKESLPSVYQTMAQEQRMEKMKQNDEEDIGSEEEP